MDGRSVGRSVELPVRWSIDWSHKYMSKLLPDHRIQSNKPNQNGLLNQKAQSLDSNGQTSTTTPTTLGQLNEWMTVAMVMNVMAEGRTDRQTVTRLLDLECLFALRFSSITWNGNLICLPTTYTRKVLIANTLLVFVPVLSMHYPVDWGKQISQQIVASFFKCFLFVATPSWQGAARNNEDVKPKSVVINSYMHNIVWLERFCVVLHWQKN